MSQITGAAARQESFAADELEWLFLVDIGRFTHCTAGVEVTPLTDKEGVDLGCSREDDLRVAGDGDHLKRTAFRRTDLLLAEVSGLARPDR